ncbi:MAG: PKD domain-containing protein [Ferruginibacter sp.]
MRVFLCFFFLLLFSSGIYSQTISPAGPIQLCPGGNQVLSVVGGAPASFQWFQNVTIVGTASTYNVTAIGNYTVVINGGGPGDTLGPVIVTAASAPTASFTVSPNAIQCGNKAYTFTATAGAGLIYTWDFGDSNSGAANNTSTINPVVHSFTGNPGSATQAMTVTLTIQNAAGCTATTNQVVTINQIPNATLTSPTGSVTFQGQTYFKACSLSPFTFTFNDATVPTPNLNYLIIWGNGNPAYNSSIPPVGVTQLYNVGNYTMQYIVTGPNNCSDTTRYGVFVGSAPSGGIGTDNPNLSGCTGATFSFPFLPGTFTNSAGTYYTITVDDGSPPTTYSQATLPPAFIHTFNTPSCGVGTSGVNYFTVSIKIQNPCNVTGIPGSIGGIKISQAPSADFTLSRDTVCVNQTVTLSNQSLNVYVNESGECVPGKSVWSITPGTAGINWNIISGTTGSTGGSPYPTTWTDGSSTLQVQFLTPGIYSASLITGGSDSCGTNTKTKTVCVNAIPTASFTVNQNTGCAPQIITTTTVASTPTCGNNKYQWTISYSPLNACTPATSAYTYVSGSNTSFQPQIQFTNPGVYTIQLVVISPGSACSSAVATQVISINVKPIIDIGGAGNQCVPASINFSAIVQDCGSAVSFVWAFPGAIPPTGTGFGVAVVYNLAGNYVVTLNGTNECGTTTVTTPMPISNVTVSNAGPIQTLCGSSATMAANTAVTGTGTWTQQPGGPNTAIITNSNSPTSTVTGLITGTYVFTWTIDNNGCTSSSNVTINISPGPTTANAGTDIGLCQANSTTLNANTPVVGTGVWTFVSGPAGSTITNPASPTTTVTGLVTGTYVFQWAISFSNCTPSTDNVQVTVYQNPTVANAGIAQVICSSTTTMAANTATVGTGTWTQVSGPAAAITTPSSPTTSITGLTPGIYVFKWKITNGTCPPTEANVQITVTDIPTTANAGTDQSLCAVSITTLSANIATVGTGTWTQVSGPTTAGITNNNLPNTGITGLIPGTYIFSWTIGNGVCPPNADNVQVIIYDNATVANAGPPQIKCGTSINMAANTATVGTGLWTAVSGPAAVITTPSSPTTTITGLTPGNYVFQWKITNGACSSVATVNITISSGPTASNAGPDQDLCLATSATLAANNPATGTGQWTQISGSTATIANQLLPNTTVTGLAVGTYVFRWTTTFSNCIPSTDDVQIRVFDNPTVANAGSDQDICLPNTSLAANAASIGTGQWTQLSGPGPATITNAASPTTTITGMIAGTYVFTWTIINGPCPPSTDNVQVIYSTISNNVISGQSAVCINTAPSIITGSIPTGSVGGYSYQWQISTNGGATWTNIAASTNIDYSPGVLTVSACYRRMVNTTLCSGPNPSNVVCITVNPDARALFAASSTLLCAPVNLDTIISVTAFPLQNQQYNWYHDGILIPGTVNGLPPSYIISNPGQTVVIKLVTTSLFGCKADSMSITFNTRPSVTANFIKDTASGCGPLGVTFTNTSTILNSSIEFYWNFGNGTILSNVMQPPAPIIYAPSPLFRDTTYYITLKAFSGCDTTYKRDSVTIFADPDARFTALAVGCSPFTDTIFNNSLGQDAYTIYYWDFGDGALDTTYTTGVLYHTYITGVVDTFTIQLIMVNRCSRDTQTMNVVVSPSNIVEHIVINGSQLYGCAPHTVNFQNSSVGASILFWDFGDGSPIEAIPNTQATVTHIYLTGNVYTVHITLENYCSDTTVLKQVTVYSPPVASFTLSSQVVCTGNSITTNNTSVNANSYEWFWGEGTSTTGFNATHTYAAGGVYLVKLVARKLNAFGIACTDTSAAVQVTVVDRIPALIDISPATNPCAPYTITVSAANAAAAAQVDWYFYDSNTAPGIFHVSGPTASYIYNVDGIDSVKLVVQNTAGCKDSTVKIFTVYKTPKVIFSPINIKTCNTDTTASFNVSVNYSGNDPLTYEWFINDVLSGNSNPFTYRFQAPGGVTAVNVFAIKVLVRNSFGCGDTTSLGNFIIQTIGPRHIVVYPSLVQEQPHYTFSFTDASVALPSSTYLWYTGDRNNQQLPGRDITYSYGDTGVYKVKLLVQDYQTGCQSTDSVNVYILAVPGYLYVPNAFCPGCHKAELRQFLPLGKGLKDYHLIIFNTWGQKVFETSSLDANGVPDQAWDGNWVNGQNVQQGAFSWYIEAHYVNGTEWKGMLNPQTGKLKKQGFISIIR